MAWDEGQPAALIKARVLDNLIRTNNVALEAAIDNEHDFETGGTQTGMHTQGSARCFFQDSPPLVRIDGTAFTSTDLGMLWIDTNSTPDNQFNILTATSPTWTPVSTEIILALLASARVFLNTLGVTGDFAVNTNKFTVAASSGNTAVAGTLGVTGVATLGDASLLATSAAPTTDAMIVNRKFVTDQITAVGTAKQYDSDWFSCVTGETYTETHNLGSIALMITLLFAPDSGGNPIESQIRVQQWNRIGITEYGGSVNIISTTQLEVQAAQDACGVYLDSNGVLATISSGHYRVLARRID